MLAELNIANFAIIENLRLEFTPGFNVFTGETGAGKSIIIDAVSLLLGGRADSHVIRAGADKATVEGIFFLSEREQQVLALLLEQESLQNQDPTVLILTREIRQSGHNICRINGRAVRLGILEQFGRQLVDIHGQSEHLSLLQERSHLDFLDRYGGLEAERAALAGQVRTLRTVRRELSDLKRSERELEQKADMLRYQVEEIRTAQLRPGEDKELEQELNRLSNAEKLSALSHEALLVLADGEENTSTAADLLGQAVRALNGLARIDPQVEPLRQQAQELDYQLGDLVSALRDYQDEVEFNPRRLAAVEERLALLRRLQRKYGDSLDDILAFAQRAAADLNTIEHSGERIAALQAQEETLLTHIGEMGAALSLHRRQAGQHLAAIVEAELDELKMEQARFAVEVAWQPEASGAIVRQPSAELGERPGAYHFESHGLDRVAFVIAPNPGEPLKPLAQVASGGETSRLMLALKTALARADETPTLIFDEIDQGIGGRVGSVVGRKLCRLSRSDGGAHQVFCVTHLPQLACYGDRHIHVRKLLADERTITRIEMLEGEARVIELAQMLGQDSELTRQTAREMLAQHGEIEAE